MEVCFVVSILTPHFYPYGDYIAGYYKKFVNTSCILEISSKNFHIKGTINSVTWG